MEKITTNHADGNGGDGKEQSAAKDVSISGTEENKNQGNSNWSPVHQELKM